MAHKPVTEAQRAQLRRLHANMGGENNPAKRPGVGSKISASVRANHPSRLYPEKWVEQAARMRAANVSKRSKLEDSVAQTMLGFERHYRIGPYEVDLANPSSRIVVEVQGCWWHCCQICFPISPTYPRQGASLANDLRKRFYLEAQGWTVKYVWEHELGSKRVQNNQGISV